MCRLVLFISIAAAANVNAVYARTPHAADSLAYPVNEYNGISYEVRLVRDSAGMPGYYHARIFTPVCDDDVCKPVYIDLYWDLLGSYLRYTVPLNEPLTKMDHEEFKREEYAKLHEILADSNSLLKDYEMEELVESATKTSPGEVDAVTGATAKSLQAVVIPGALYTCYTLWHIAHGRVVDTIAKITDSLVDPPLLLHFLESRNHRYQYFALDKVMDNQGNVEPDYRELVINLIRSPNVFLAAHVLKRLSPTYFSDEERQNWLWETFLGGSYRLKLGILDKLEQLPLTEALRTRLATDKGNFNEVIAERIEHLLNRQS